MAAQRPRDAGCASSAPKPRNAAARDCGPRFDALWLTPSSPCPGPPCWRSSAGRMDSLSESEFVRALGVALRFTAVCLLLVELVRHLCRHGGLADAHFDWPDACLAHAPPQAPLAHHAGPAAGALAGRASRCKTSSRCGARRWAARCSSRVMLLLAARVAPHPARREQPLPAARAVQRAEAGSRRCSSPGGRRSCCCRRRWPCSRRSATTTPPNRRPCACCKPSPCCWPC